MQRSKFLEQVAYPLRRAETGTAVHSQRRAADPSVTPIRWRVRWRR